MQVLLTIQKRHCAICWDVLAEHIDHDHATGAVRGMLCSGCNSGMGRLGDDPTSLRRAADYLLGELIKMVSASDAGERMSFTVPDVDPATVPLDGWESYRKLDGQHRKRVLDLDEDEGPSWFEILHGKE